MLTEPPRDGKGSGAGHFLPTERNLTANNSSLGAVLIHQDAVPWALNPVGSADGFSRFESLNSAMKVHLNCPWS